MKTMKGLDLWTKSAVWLEMLIPAYFFGKTFGTSDARYRVLDKFMYPEAFIKLSGFFRDLPPHELYYTGRFLGVISGAAIGILFGLFIGLLYKWVMKDWAFAKAARIGNLAFIVIALLTGFMADFFNENIGMALRIQEKEPDEQVGRYLTLDYGGFEKGTLITEQNASLLAYYGKVKANSPASAKRWWLGSLYFMYSWFILYFLCARRLYIRNKVPRHYWFKLQTVNFVVLLMYLRMGFGISFEEFHYIITRAPYIFGGS
ncbi:MAG: hypothetical protein WCQ99_14115 [Pseudomonadota bacterium]